jgi:hypothetical protein
MRAVVLAGSTAAAMLPPATPTAMQRGSVRVSQVVELVSGALRYKLSREGVGSLSAVEWHLLHISQFIDAIERGRLQRMLSDSPLAELMSLADGLDAIESRDAATAVRVAAADISLTNTPGEGAKRRPALVGITARLDAAVSGERGVIEQRLLDYAFRQPELAQQPVAAD